MSKCNQIMCRVTSRHFTAYYFILYTHFILIFVPSDHFSLVIFNILILFRGLMTDYYERFRALFSTFSYRMIDRFCHKSDQKWGIMPHFHYFII